jgi:hypothetical protein
MMEQTKGIAQMVVTQAEGSAQPAEQVAERSDTRSAQCDSGQCGTGEMTYSYAYVICTIEPRFPSRAVERELAQATGRAEETAGLTDREALRSVLTERANRYLVRQICFVATIEGLESYILQPRDMTDYYLLAEAVRPAPRPTDVDVVIGVRGPVAPPERCNGLMVPILAFDQIYSFDVDSLIQGLRRPNSIPEEEEDSFRSAAEELFYRVMQIADNAGATDEHRAVNYLTVRYDRIYAQTAEMYGRDFSLSGVEVRPSRLSGTRKVVDVVFSYTNRNTDVVDKHYVRVDVSEEFPFLVTKMSPFYDR